MNPLRLSLLLSLLLGLFLIFAEMHGAHAQTLDYQVGSHDPGSTPQQACYNALAAERPQDMGFYGPTYNHEEVIGTECWFYFNTTPQWKLGDIVNIGGGDPDPDPDPDPTGSTYTTDEALELMPFVALFFSFVLGFSTGFRR